MISRLDQCRCLPLPFRGAVNRKAVFVGCEYRLSPTTGEIVRFYSGVQNPAQPLNKFGSVCWVASRLSKLCVCTFSVGPLQKKSTNLDGIDCRLFVISPDLCVGIPNLLGATRAPPEQVRDSVVLARRNPKEPDCYKRQGTDVGRTLPASAAVVGIDCARLTLLCVQEAL